MIRLLALLAFAPAVNAQDFARLADCIRQVETKSHRQIGPAGERSEYQLTRAVWHRYTDLDFRSASTSGARAEAQRVAVAHLRHIWNAVENPTIYRAALAWNAGIGATNRCRVTRAQADYARRVENLYHEKK